MIPSFLTAHTALNAMIASPARHVGFSLDALWRSVGSPDRQDPDSWLELSRTVVDSMRAYRRKLVATSLDGTPGEAAVRDPVKRANAATVAALDAIVGAGHGYELRDMLVDEEVAVMYCMFLDREGLRRNYTAEGKRQRRDFEAKLALLPDADLVRRLDPMPKAAPAIVGPAQVG